MPLDSGSHINAFGQHITRNAQLDSYAIDR